VEIAPVTLTGKVVWLEPLSEKHVPDLTVAAHDERICITCCMSIPIPRRRCWPGCVIFFRARLWEPIWPLPSYNLQADAPSARRATWRSARRTAAWRSVGRGMQPSSSARRSIPSANIFC